MRFLALLFGLALLPASLPANLLPSLAAEPPTLHAVLLAEGEPPRRVEDAAGLSREELAGVQAVWLWGADASPRRLPIKALALPPRPDPERLKIVIPTGGRKLPAGFTVVAAPAAMWREVPESLLPSWPVPPGGRVLVPVSPSTAWRVRLVGPPAPGSGRGTAWVEVEPGRPRIVLAPQPAADRGITVVDPEGNPLAASLTVLRRVEEGGEVLAQYTSTKREPLTLPRLPETEPLHFLFTHAGHAPRALLGAPQHWPTVLRLEPGGAVEGRFVDARGKPVPGVEVLAQAWVPGADSAVAERQATSGENGRFTLASLPRGTVALFARVPGFAPWQHRLDDAAGTVQLGDIPLNRGLRLAVSVRDEAGMAVAGTRLHGRGITAAVTDRRGHGMLTGVPDAAFTVHAEAPGHLPAAKTLHPPFPETVEVALRRAFHIRGRLLTEDGLPVADGTVRVSVGNRYRDETLSPDGAFDLLTEPETDVTLEWRSPATVPLRLGLEPGGAGELRDLGDLVAEAGVVVRGQVVRASDGLPVAGARIWSPRPTGAGESVVWAQGDLVEARSRADGTFILAGLELRPMVLRIEAGGFARRHVSLTPDPETGFPPLETVELEAGATLRIVTEEAAAEGALARVDLRGRWRDLDMLTATVVEGEAILEPIPTGEVTVTVFAGRDLLCEEIVEVPPGATEQEVPCRSRGMEVGGTVVLGDRAAHGGKLRWRFPTAFAEPGLIQRRVTSAGLSGSRVYGSGRPSVEVPIADDGTFQTRLRAGEWEVAWVSPDGVPTAVAETVRLRSPGPHQVTLRYPETVVSGHVVDEEGQPVANARIRQVEGGGFALSRADGSFELLGLGDGEHAVQARLGDRASSVTPVPVAPGERPEPLRLVLRSRQPQSVRITVVDPEDRPRPGAFVFLEDDRGRRRVLTTNAEGWVEARLEEAGGSRYRVAAVDDGRWSFGSWQERETALEEGLRLALTETGALRLSGEETALVAVIAPGGWDLAALLTQVGERPLVQAEAPILLRGLPAGHYRVHVGDAHRTAAVRGGEEVEIDFGGR